MLDVKVVREADLCLTILGEETGKILAIARSARRSKKRFFGGVDLVECGTFELTLQPKSTQWYTLAGVSERHAWTNLLRDTTVFSIAALCLEITRELTAEGDAEGGALLAPLVRTFRALEKTADAGERLSIAAYYLVLIHQMSGFDAAAGDTPVSASDAWYKAMLVNQQPIVPHDPQTLYEGFRYLLAHAQKTVERALRTTDDVGRILSEFKAKNYAA